jgi:hypothetical protein
MPQTTFSSIAGPIPNGLLSAEIQERSMLKRTITLSSLTLATLGLATPGSACSGQYAGLAKYAGREPSLLLENPELSVKLATLMGPELDHLQRNLAVHGYLNLIDCELVVEGNAPHGGGRQNAIVSFNLSWGILTVGMLDNRRIFMWSTRHKTRDHSNYSHLPAHVRDWAYVAANGFRSRGEPVVSATMVP